MIKKMLIGAAMIAATFNAQAANQDQNQEIKELSKKDQITHVVDATKTNSTLMQIQDTTTKDTQAKPKISKQKSSLEAIQTVSDGNSYLRPNLFYKLPGNISGYSWAEFYTNGTFYGKNTLTKNIVGPLNVINQTVYGTGFKTRTGIGASVGFSPLENTFAKVHFVPAFLTYEGNKVENNVNTGFFASVDLPKGFCISTFADFNLNGTKGPELSYGELNVEKKFGDISLSYNPSFTGLGKGRTSFKTDHRFTFKYSFD